MNIFCMGCGQATKYIASNGRPSHCCHCGAAFYSCPETNQEKGAGADLDDDSEVSSLLDSVLGMSVTVIDENII